MKPLFLSVALLGASITGLASCGGEVATSNVAALHTSSAPALPVRDLERQLAAGVRDGLARLAVMQQPADGAADLGQDLPEGLLRSVRCAEPVAATGTSPARSTTCEVRWETASGTPRRTAYSVTLGPGSCFVATATPALHPVHDATIQTYAEHPLARVFSVERGC